ncbi:MAG: hypothetical protein JXA79_11675 [Deltaproteobacteria bacterium]|nr:hypothetical protein [Deltaproteobacteria bacterium]
MSRKKIKTPKRVDLTPQQMEELCKRLEDRNLEEADWEIIKGMAQTISFLSQAVEEKGLSIKRLLGLVFGYSTESSKNVLKKAKDDKNDLPENPTDTDPVDNKQKGHGRNGASSYQGANNSR